MKKLIKPDDTGIREEVREFIVSTFLGSGVNGDLEDDDLLFDSGVIDSIGAMELISFIQARYRINILDEDLFPENFSSIARISSFVLRKQNGQAGGKRSHG